MEKKWEYISFICAGEEIERTLNPLGEEGWELIGMVIIIDVKSAERSSLNTLDNYRVVLKRQRE